MASMYINYGSFEEWANKISTKNDKLSKNLVEIKKNTTKKTKIKTVTTPKMPKNKWYALMGYNKNNEDETGLLGFDIELKNPYKIVHDI